MKNQDYTIHPSLTTFELHNFRGRFSAVVQWFRPELIFTLDIYSFMQRKHPQTHLGWWRFQLYEGQNDIEFILDFNDLHVGSVIAKINGKFHSAIDAWINLNFNFSPLLDVLLTVRKPNNEPVDEIPIAVKIKDEMILKKYYHDIHEDQKYTDEQQRPFLPVMHEHKLKLLKKIFSTFTEPQWKVLDIGCGRSLFAEIKANWPFHIFAGDLEYPLIAMRKKEFPQIKWLLMNAISLPFKDNTFDALFAGELIEHMPDPQNALLEWNRVLRTKGMVIITTPNKNRLSNYINKYERPFSPDHFREFSLEELKNEILPDAGFTVRKATGTYLELLLFSKYAGIKISSIREDYLQREGNKNKNIFLMKLFNRLGTFVPSHCLDLVIIAEKNKVPVI